jgi:transposase
MLNAGLPVRSVNPWKLRQFAKAAGWLAKNDRLDAHAIACFVATLPTRAVQHDPTRQHLAELVTARRQIVDLGQELGNQLGHLRAGRGDVQSVVKAFKQRLLDGGKKPKVAIVAVMRKLLTTLNAMLRERQEWRAAGA